MNYVCADCPRQCYAIREDHIGHGFCRMGQEAVLARAALHFDEEPVISGTRGSGAVFFSGCSLRCCFCQNYEISHTSFGKRVSYLRLREIYHELKAQGAHNINLVNPDHFAEPILYSLEEDPGLPVVWNSSGYECVQTLRRFEGRVNVYLPDFKYYHAASSKRYSGVKDYFEYASTAIKEMWRQVGPVRLDDDGIIQSGLIIRHLILPGCTDESCKILDWIAKEVPGAWVSLMSQYMPWGDLSGVDELKRRITQEEYDKVVDHLFDLGLEDGFVQDLDSSDAKYVPLFDLTGV